MADPELLLVCRQTSYEVAPLELLHVIRTLSVYVPSVAETPDGGEGGLILLYPELDELKPLVPPAFFAFIQ